MRRQGMIVTTKELRDLADSLDLEIIGLAKRLSLKTGKVNETKHQINIINKSDTSDTWEIEK